MAYPSDQLNPTKMEDAFKKMMRNEGGRFCGDISRSPLMLLSPDLLPVSEDRLDDMRRALLRLRPLAAARQAATDAAWRE